MQNLAPALIDYFASGRVLGPRGNASDRYAPHGAYRCADEDGNERWIALAVADDDQWQSMLGALGADSTDERFATMSERIENAPALDEFIGSLTRSHEARGLTVRLQAAGIAAYLVENCVDLHQDDNLESFGFWHWLDHKEMGASPYEGLSHRMSRTPGTLRSPAPILGQDNDEVFREMLSLSTDEIEQLKRENVIF
jgi:benzylsuccinate CoA-transferase BbsF subunit